VLILKSFQHAFVEFLIIRQTHCDSNQNGNRLRHFCILFENRQENLTAVFLVIDDSDLIGLQYCAVIRTSGKVLSPVMLTLP